MYSEGELVASVTVDAILTLLEGATVTTVGNNTVNTVDYEGNPRNTALSPGEPFLYLNLYGTGGASFDQIKLIGGGFELDNIAVSNLPQVPGSTEIAIEFIPGENEPPAANEEPLANTGMGETNLFGLGLTVVGLAAAAVVLRRKRARV
jgi:LPXTG-motif cell wall-anchored protein